MLQGESFGYENVAIKAASTLSCSQHAVTMFLVLRVRGYLLKMLCLQELSKFQNLELTVCFIAMAKARSFSFSSSSINYDARVYTFYL